MNHINRMNRMNRIKRLLLTLLTIIGFSTHAAPKINDTVETWFKDPVFKKLYTEALAKSPANQKSSWAYQDINLQRSKAIKGQNANTWVHLSTCASTQKTLCRLNHVDIFYDEANQELFAYLSIGSRVGWMGAGRNPTSLEQKFFTPYLTAKDIR